MTRDELDLYQKKTIYDILNPVNIQETCPILLVGKAVTLFKNMYKDSIQELKNTDDVKSLISEYAGLISPKPVVISDLGNLQRQSAFLLLKLVEEAKFPVILLSTEDKVDSILLSRIKRVIKFPVNENTNNNLISIQDGYNHVYGSEKKINDKTSFYAENCPLLYKLESEVPFNKYRNAIIQILGVNYDN